MKMIKIKMGNGFVFHYNGEDKHKLEGDRVVTEGLPAVVGEDPESG